LRGGRRAFGRRRRSRARTAPLAEAVLALLAAGAPAGEELAALALPDADGEPARATS
jgi:hypothetical protein